LYALARPDAVMDDIDEVTAWRTPEHVVEQTVLLGIEQAERPVCLDLVAREPNHVCDSSAVIARRTARA
jgi:hypothetical protein